MKKEREEQEKASEELIKRLLAQDQIRPGETEEKSAAAPVSGSLPSSKNNNTNMVGDSSVK